MSEETESLVNPSHKTSLAEFLSHEYEAIATSYLADVSIYCKNTIFKAHRIVLSHYSKFFRSVFESVDGSKHFDLFLEGFQDNEVEAVLTFCYTGTLVWGGGGGKESLVDAANALQIDSLSSFLSTRPDPVDNNNKQEVVNSPPHDSSSPVSIWQKCASEGQDEELEFGSDDEVDSYYYECNQSNKRDASDSVNKRRKQARPKRHKPTPPHSRSTSPVEEMSCTDDEDEYTPPDSFEDEDINSTSPPEDPHPSAPQPTPQQPAPQSIQLLHESIPPPPPPPPPHYLFLRNMIHHQVPGGGPPPPPPHFFPHPATQQMGKKLGLPQKGIWGKMISKQPGVFHHHGSSRAQHSAPRGGPPRAWSNQDLTEALHNVWNKKMTTSQASRIFGIPYNSLLMYVRGKYGKSLKLDLLKKGLDLALLEKQKLKTTNSEGSGQQNGSEARSGSTGSSTSSREQVTTPQRANVVEWMMMGGGGNKLLDNQRICFPNMFFPDNRKNEVARKQEIGK